MAASTLSHSPPVQQLTALWTLSSPAIKTHRPPPLFTPPAHPPPLFTPPAHSHPPRSKGTHALQFLDLDPTATHTASRAPDSHLTPQGAIPPLVTTGAHEAQSVTWTDALLQALQHLLLTSHLGLPSFTPPPTC